VLIEAVLIATVLAHRKTSAVSRSLLQERSEHYDRRDHDHAVRTARSRWLHAHGAISTFPCGVVRPVPPRPDVPGPPSPLGDEVPVLAAVLPDAVTFLVDPPAGFISDDPIEVGSIRRDALREVLVERGGAPVPRPAAESFEEEPEVALVLRWEGDEQRLWFRSAWLAWRTADRFTETKGT
jgi:hypothetical protein